jgi:hypothetical protein
MERFENKGSLKLNLTILFVLVFVAAIGFLGIIFEENSYYAQYPLINYETQVVDKFEEIKRAHGGLQIELTSGRKIGIAWADNYDYDPPEVYRLASRGDSIIKKSNCDTFKIKRGNDIYVFVIQERINIENKEK